MREPKDFPQAVVMLKELAQWKDRLSSKSQDLKGLKIQGAGDATEPQDYVTLRQLQQATNVQVAPNQNFSIPFSSVGPVTTGQKSAPFIVDTSRVGNPLAIGVAVPSLTEAPTSGDLIINLALNGTNMLISDLHLPVGSEGPVFSSQLVSPVPKLITGAKLVPIIIQGGGAQYVTIQLYVVRVLP